MMNDSAPVVTASAEPGVEVSGNIFGRFEGELEVRYIKQPKRRWWLRWLPQRRRWLVRSPFTYCGGDVLPICFGVRVGTIIDFASIPFVFIWLLGPMNSLTSDYGRVAAIHDELYQHGAAMDPPVSRETADLVLYYGIRCEEGWRVTAYVMWLAVRLFGWTAYKKSP
jgi:hypothetical protein